LGEQLESLASVVPRKRTQVDARKERNVEDDERQGVSTASGAMERGHRAREAAGDQLAVEDRAVPQNREQLREAPETDLEAVTAEPVPMDAAPVALLGGAVRQER
jgi:hypothetical protein